MRRRTFLFASASGIALPNIGLAEEPRDTKTKSEDLVSHILTNPSPRGVTEYREFKGREQPNLMVRLEEDELRYEIHVSKGGSGLIYLNINYRLKDGSCFWWVRSSYD
jgi:hypothetical protein